jgi:hypothetical protein
MARTIACFSLACLLGLLLPVQQAASSVAPTFRVNVDLMQIDAVVTDAKHRPARDPEAADFQVFEDGRPQAITSFSYVAVTALPSGTSPRRRVQPPPEICVARMSGAWRSSCSTMRERIRNNSPRWWRRPRISSIRALRLATWLL